MQIRHVTISCSDLEKSIAFFKEVAGIEIQQDLRQFGSPIVFMADSAEAAKIELIASPEAPYSGTGISIGFTCADVDAEQARLKAAGYEVTDMISPNPHVKFFFVTGPDGVRVQLVG